MLTGVSTTTVWSDTTVSGSPKRAKVVLSSTPDVADGVQNASIHLE